MNKKIKVIALVSALMASFSIGVLASNGIENVTAQLNHALKMQVNDSEWHPIDTDGTELKPLTYNDRTYLPVRAIAEKFGIPIDYDADTQTVILGDSGVTKVSASHFKDRGEFYNDDEYDIVTDKSETTIGTETFDSVIKMDAGYNYTCINTEGFDKISGVFENTGSNPIDIYITDKDAVNKIEEDALIIEHLESGEIKRLTTDLKGAKKVYIRTIRTTVEPEHGNRVIKIGDLVLKK